jgi:hypothetical protein
LYIGYWYHKTGSAGINKVRERSMEKRGILIEIKGANCSGKTYLIEKLKPFLDNLGYDCIESDVMYSFNKKAEIHKIIPQHDITIVETVDNGIFNRSADAIFFDIIITFKPRYPRILFLKIKTIKCKCNSKPFTTGEFTYYSLIDGSELQIATIRILSIMIKPIYK